VPGTVVNEADRLQVRPSSSLASTRQSCAPSAIVASRSGAVHVSAPVEVIGSHEPPSIWYRTDRTRLVVL
jgi:hypothetical protein